MMPEILPERRPVVGSLDSEAGEDLSNLSGFPAVVTVEEFQLRSIDCLVIHNLPTLQEHHKIHPFSNAFAWIWTISEALIPDYGGRRERPVSAARCRQFDLMSDHI